MNTAYGSVKKTVYDALLNDITKGELKPYDIVTESMLAARFGVSKMSIREALIELCKDNVLKSIPRSGYQVIPCTIEEIIDILDFRIDLETSNLRHCKDRLTPEALSAFDAILCRREEKKTDEISYVYYSNRDFHLALCALSGNAFTYRILEIVLKQSSRFFSIYYRYAWTNIVEPEEGYHVQVVEALRAGDIERACSVLIEDINSVRDQLRKIIGS